MDNKNMTVADTIREKYTKLFPAEQKVAKYIVDHTQEVVNYNVAELAKKSQASEATVVRTCKHLGFDGYYQMRLLLSKDVGKFESQEAENENLTSSQKFFSLEAERQNSPYCSSRKYHSNFSGSWLQTRTSRNCMHIFCTP